MISKKKRDIGCQKVHLNELKLLRINVLLADTKTWKTWNICHNLLSVRMVKSCAAQFNRWVVNHTNIKKGE